MQPGQAVTAFLDLYIMVPPLYVEFGEEGVSLEASGEGMDVW